MKTMKSLYSNVLLIKNISVPSPPENKENILEKWLISWINNTSESTTN